MPDPSPNALVLLAPGFEEIEAVTVIDVLRRAGVEVVAAGIVPGPLRASRGVVVVPDTTLDALGERPWNVIVLPGGAPGAKALREDARVLALLRAHAAAGRLVAAICAAPTVLERAGLLTGKRVTAHPSVHAELRAAGIDVRADERVVVDGEMITSQAPGTSIEFAYAIVARLCGDAKVAELDAGIRARA